mgnify:CR=1 FL=1
MPALASTALSVTGSHKQILVWRRCSRPTYAGVENIASDEVYCLRPKDYLAAASSKIFCRSFSSLAISSSMTRPALPWIRDWKSCIRCFALR